MNRYVCIHGHFYQPPRENAWLEAIEIQISAYPYHDWNELITAQCYLPNTASKILDNTDRIVDMVNNYAKISFDFGPTLLSWLEKQAPDVYSAILEADKESRKNFSGHGSALAHAYNHLIMPLANQRDKITQVLWGVRDFEYRFRRQPEGMWLPETAVDLETLDILAESGIKFTILAPHQAARIRKIGDMEWQDVNEKSIDTTIPYLIILPSGRKLDVFFYNSAIAVSVAFHGLLKSGEELANQLVRSLPANMEHPRLAHIATDGESYGHHHRFGDMALAYALHYIEKNRLAQITNYGEFLEKQPPLYEVEILENTSWSCAHGIERWRSNCGCADHHHQGWDQSWRTTLRRALDWLRDNITPYYEQKACKFFKDPWQARNDYIEVILDRSPDATTNFLKKHLIRELTGVKIVDALKLLELQRNALLMYTSCGWFFDDPARIESLQIIHYTARVIQLAEELFGKTIEAEFLEHLSAVRSNVVGYGNGSQLYQRFVKPAVLDLEKIAAHFAISSLFESYPDTVTLYCYEIHNRDFGHQKCGKNNINFGRIRVSSLITTESKTFTFLGLLREDNTIAAGIDSYKADDLYEKLVNEICIACSRDDLLSLELLLKNSSPGSSYTTSSLFRDTQHDILENIMDSSVAGVKSLFYPGLQSYSSATPMIGESSFPLPVAFRPLVQLVFNLDLRNALRTEQPNVEAVQRMLNDARLWRIDLDNERLGITLTKTIENSMSTFMSLPENTAFIDNLVAIVVFARALPFPVDLQRTQSYFYRLMKTVYIDYIKRMHDGDSAAATWVNKFRVLGEKLSIEVQVD